MKLILLNLVSKLLLEVKSVRKQSQQNQTKLMAALDDLSASVTQLNATTATLVTAVDAAVTDIQQLGPNDAQLQALKGSIDAVNSTLAAQASRLTTAVGAPTPPPAP